VTGGPVDKSALRAQALAARARGGDQAALQRRLVEVLAPHAGRVLAGYWPMKGEPDPRPAMAAHEGPVCLPVVPGRAVPLIFRRWRGEPLDRGPLGTSQPPASLPEITPEVLIVPLVAFDGRLNRLGYGGGYYDRTLAAMMRRPTTVGVGFELSRLETVYPQPHDVPLDVVVTEAGVKRR